MAIVLLKPNYPPYVCIVCGLGSSKDRKWFVDLQLAIDNYFNPVNDGAVYLCNQCWDGLNREVGHKAFTLMREEEPWEANLEITYAAEGELIQSRPLASNPSTSSLGAGDNSSPPVGIMESSDQPVGNNTSAEPEITPVGFKEVENDGTGLPSEGSGDSDPTITGDDTTTETTTSEHGPDDSDDAEPVQQFREFFGKPV
jgi:hypothetical protein